MHYLYFYILKIKKKTIGVLIIPKFLIVKNFLLCVNEVLKKIYLVIKMSIMFSNSLLSDTTCK